MSTNKERVVRFMVASAAAGSLVLCLALPELSGQIRRGRRGVAFRGEEGRGAAIGPRGAVVKGDEGYAAVGRYGRRAVVKGEEGKGAAIGPRGAIVKGEEGVAAVGRYGRRAVVAGEEHFAARGPFGNVVVGNRYEDFEAWRAVAGVGAAIAIGTMLARPPAQATTVVISGTTYWRYQNTYYARVYSGGSVVYQVVAPPR